MPQQLALHDDCAVQNEGWVPVQGQGWRGLHVVVHFSSSLLMQQAVQQHKVPPPRQVIFITAYQSRQPLVPEQTSYEVQ